MCRRNERLPKDPKQSSLFSRSQSWALFVILLVWCRSRSTLVFKMGPAPIPEREPKVVQHIVDERTVSGVPRQSKQQQQQQQQLTSSLFSFSFGEKHKSPPQSSTKRTIEPFVHFFPLIQQRTPPPDFPPHPSFPPSPPPTLSPPCTNHTRRTTRHDDINQKTKTKNRERSRNPPRR